MKNITFRRLLMCVTCLSSVSYLASFWMDRKPNVNSRNINLVQSQDGKDAEILVVGGGLSGAIIAHLHATLLRKKVLLVEKRSHVGGSCYDYIDKYGIRVSKYGLHVLHTNNKLVWLYLRQFSKWIPYEHRVVTMIKDQYVPIPLNIESINTIFNQSITNSKDMIKWLKYNPFANGDHKTNDSPVKQKEKLAKELADDINKWFGVCKNRNTSQSQLIPVRRNFDDRYFPNYIYTALPADGYTSVITRMLNHPRITILLNVDYNPLENYEQSFPNVSKTFFTGRIDTYFEKSRLPELKYRCILFETLHLNKMLFQPNIVVQHPQNTKRYSRVVEYRHQTNPRDAGTTIVREYLGDRGYPYYPICDEHSTKLYHKYAVLAQREMKRNVYFVGGLGHYQYFSIGETVMNAIADFKRAYPNMSFPDSDIFPEPSTVSPDSEIFSKASIAFITSHCKESLSWISKHVVRLCARYKINIFIYEKCGKINMGSKMIRKHPQCHIHQIQLPNVGREGHSWLHHMMTQQSLFADVNVFLQGGKEVSARILFRTINRMKNLSNLYSPTYFETPTRELSAHYVPFSITKCFNITNDALDWTIDAILERTCDYFHLITKTREHCTEYEVNFRGEFAVTGALLHRVLARHRHVLSLWYKELSTRRNPLQGHLVERSWTLLFRYPFIPRCQLSVLNPPG